MYSWDRELEDLWIDETIIRWAIFIIFMIVVPLLERCSIKLLKILCFVAMVM